MHQAVLVDILQPKRRLAGHLAGIAYRHGAEAADDLRQVEPLDVFHHEHRRAVDLPGVVGADDVVMVQLADGLHLAFEAGDRPRVLRAARRKHLERDHPIELGVQGLVDRAHAAVAQLLDQLILAKDRPANRTAGWGVAGVSPVVSMAARARATARRHCDSSRYGSVAARLAQLGHEGILGVIKGNQARLAVGTGVEVGGNGLRGLVGKPAGGVGKQFITAGASQGRHLPGSCNLCSMVRYQE